MKKQIIYLCLAAASLLPAACASEDSVEGPENKASIKFSAVVPGRTRANPTTTASIQSFKVYAFTQGQTLIDGVNVTRDGGTWTYSPEVYWPVSPVNFYAFSPDISSGVGFQNGTSGNIKDYLNDGTVDLLYSTKMDVMQQAAPVELNFRHALSNVNVLLSSSNPKIQVKLWHVKLGNIYLQGSFDFPQQSTLASTPDVKGKWSMLKNLNDILLFYAMSADDVQTLTPVPTNYTLESLRTGFIIPQPLTRVELTEGQYTGTYISVECEIYDTATGAKLWPNSHTPDYMLVAHSECGRIVYPAMAANVNEWLQGHIWKSRCRLTPVGGKKLTPSSK